MILFSQLGFYNFIILCKKNKKTYSEGVKKHENCNKTLKTPACNTKGKAEQIISTAQWKNTLRQKTRSSKFV